ncbi:MAG: nucleoside 2-deoxyribosyltransferase domain-containing protein [Thermoflexibacter sp.]|jgi:hypothetical protein|nr:nucleoside 2-deoxyribosyltransferase domain-containing protein [Thermoflexibacter sp.]
MRIIYPPDLIEINLKEKTIFLAGSIENGTAEDWQSVFAQEVEGADLALLNPRRKAWDATWEQSIHNPLFVQQVQWELEGLEKSDLIVMNFVPNTLSPISLLEFGLYARSGKLIVCCPNSFWRKGNIDVVCHRYQIEQVNTLKELAEKALIRLF